MFVDTSGWASVLDRRQARHEAASAILKAAHGEGRIVVTTGFVLAELTALLTSPLRVPRPRQIAFLRDIRAASWVEVVPIDADLEAASWDLWAARPDKAWSLVDCSSFVVMERRGLAEALTTDGHFEQAGYLRLLR